MEIRANKTDYNKLKKLAKKQGYTGDITLDENVSSPVIMVHITEPNTSAGENNPKASLQEWTRGFEHIESFIKYGYVRITKNCPYRLGKCIGEKCALYIIKNNTGDCAHAWDIYLR